LQGKSQITLISDGAQILPMRSKKEFFTINNPRTRHIRHIHIQGDHNNAKKERMNGEIRDREKVMRGLKIGHQNSSWLSNLSQLF